jgi:uncharacterized protein (TIGR03663 family)
MKWGYTAALLLVVAGALALRLPQLDRRPLHTDESVHTIKFKGLWEQGVYRYDPHEYHGPSLYYLTLPAAWASGAHTFAETNEATYRMVPVLFGLGLILLLPLLRDGLGRTASVAAGIFTAVSPAMVFYSRYYIHEMLLVFFTTLLLAAGWRYLRSRRWGWALLAGAALGLMHATKETFVFVLVAAAGAACLTWIWSRWVDGTPPDLARALRPTPLIAAGGVALLISIALFTSLFTNASGPMDSLRTYAPWFSRAGGDSPHHHPWHYYLGLLAWYRVGRGPLWTEGLVLALAAVGFVAALRRRGATSPPQAATPNRGDSALPSSGEAACSSAPLVRFIGFYAILLAAIYSFIPYKTPWCLLGFLHAFLLLAGVGAATLLEWARSARLRIALAFALALGAAQLGVQAYRASYPYCDSQRNPYVYAHTLSDLLSLVERVNQLAALDVRGFAMPVRVLVRGGGAWPLPWYLRRFTRVEWDPQPTLDPRFPVVIASPAYEGLIQEKLAGTHEPAGHFGLRPGPNGLLGLFVETKLWDAYLNAPKPI